MRKILLLAGVIGSFCLTAQASLYDDHNACARKILQKYRSTPGTALLWAASRVCSGQQGLASVSPNEVVLAGEQSLLRMLTSLHAVLKNSDLSDGVKTNMYRAVAQMIELECSGERSAYFSNKQLKEGSFYLGSARRIQQQYTDPDRVAWSPLFPEEKLKWKSEQLDDATRRMYEHMSECALAVLGYASICCSIRDGEFFMGYPLSDDI